MPFKTHFQNGAWLFTTYLSGILTLSSLHFISTLVLHYKQNGCKDAGNQSETMYQDGKIFLIFLLKIFLILLLAEAEPIQAKHCNGEILAKEICIPKKYVDGIQNCPNSPPNNRIMAKMGNVQVIEVDDRSTVFDF